ncbi:MAG: Peptidoglycan-binding LysM [Frankiales bacterium]|nr:Peptidoglycan-binding LysM [Frankiales bacterium]
MSHRAWKQYAWHSGARTVGLLVLLTAVVTAGAPSVIHLKSGDTLSALARRHHTTVAALQKANHLRGTKIYAGELLRIPGNATPTVASRPRASRTVKHVYTVRSGDNLTRLARRFHTTNAGLTKINRLRTSTVFVGQHLIYATTTTTHSTATNAGRPISGTVQRSAAQHRARLRATHLPSKATVRAMVTASARRHGVPPAFALALAYQESGFQQRVVSPVDAIGVMQVLPSTGRSLARMHGRRYDLLKASDNIEAGVTLLRDLLDATGTQAKAMAGYYQGLGSVRRIGVLPQTKAYVRSIGMLQKRFQ